MSLRRDKKRQAEPPQPIAPVRGVSADMSKQVPNNSWGPSITAYFDIAFRCRDCGKEEIWTAEQQKWYFEEAKGSLYATAVRCHECRNRLKVQKQLQRQQMEKAALQGNEDP